MAMDHFGRDEEDFLESELYQNSCCFAIEQIGEAVKRMPLFIGVHPGNPSLQMREERMRILSMRRFS